MKENSKHLPQTEEELLNYAVASAIIKNVVEFVKATDPAKDFKIDAKFEVNGKNYRIVICEHGLTDNLKSLNN